MASITRDRGHSKTWAERSGPIAISTDSPSRAIAKSPEGEPQDDSWKEIQKQVFTRWCNERLKVVNIEIVALPDDFCDGVKLINLVQVLSKKTVGRFSKKPRIHAQKMENVELALSLLTKKEKIKIVNIGSGDIVEGNLKLTLGLVWTLILHYQISIGFGIDTRRSGSISAKQVLMDFVQDIMPHQKVTNFTTDWNDGRLVAGLVDGTAPGLCPEAYTMTADTPLENAKHAMTLAEDWLGVPMLLLPENIVNPHVDSLSVITYLAQFSEAKLVEGAPIQEGGDPSKVKADGDGLMSEGLFASEEPVEFTVDVSEAKPFGSLRVSIIDPNNLEIRPEVKFNNDVYTYRYSPIESGAYTISINWWGKPITGSPFTVNVGRRMALSPRHSASASTRSSLSSAVSVYGSGVEGGNLRACEPAGFWVEGVPSNSTLQIKVVGPQGQLGSEYVTVQGVAKGYYYVLYYPLVSGTYKITTCISGKDIGQSPYTVSVGEKSSLVQGWARGPGIDGTNIEVSSKTWFNVFVPSGSSRDVIVEIEGPKGKVTATQEKAIMSVFRYTYVPKQQGRYKITVIIGPRGRAITLYFIVIAPSSVTKGSFKVWGKGIAPRGVQARQKAEVYFQPIAADQEVALDIKSEDGEQVPFSESSENGITTFTYIPPMVGCYIITFLSNGEPIHSTPFKVNVTDVSKIIFTGENMDGSAVPIKKKLVYNVDARKAGYAQLACQVVSVKDSRVTSLSPKILQKKDSTYEIVVQPIVICEEELLFTYDDALLTQNPIRINAVDVSQIKVYGRGIQKGNVAMKSTSFKVDLNKAGSGKLVVVVTGPVDPTVDVTPTSENFVFNCEYTPTEPGEYSATVTFAGFETKGSPYKFEVLPAGGNAASSRIAMYGPAVEGPLTVGTPGEFFIALGPGNMKSANVSVKGPEGEEKVKQEPIKEKEVVQYSFPVFQPGPYFISADFNGTPVEGSPFETKSEFPDNLPKVSVSGKGLRQAIVNDWAEFEIDSQAEGSGSLDVTVNGPSGAETKMEGKGNGKVAVKYRPTSTGEHQINVLFNNQAIPGSPFPIAVEAKTEVIKLEPTGVSLGSDFTYSIDTSKATKPVSVTGKVLGPFTKGTVPEALKSKAITVKSFSRVAGNLVVTNPKVSEKNKIYTVAFTPRKVGVYLIYVFAGDRLVDKMPYEVYVCDPSKIKVKGPGLGKNKNENSHIDKPLMWEADCTQAGPGTFAAYVGGPDNCTKDVTVEPASSPDQYSISYTPNVPGGYQLLFAYSGFQTSDKPTIMISDPSKAQMGDKGDRVCLVNEKVSFPLDLSAAGAGKLQAYSPYTVPILAEGAVIAEPQMAVMETNTDLFAGLNIPLESRPNLYGPAVEGPLTVGTPGEFFIALGPENMKSANVSVKGPEGEEKVKQEPIKENEVVQYSFPVFQPGPYFISADFNGTPVEGSPFETKSEFPDNLPKVTASGKGLREAFVNDWAEFEIGSQAEGSGSLDVTVNGPSGAEIKMEEKDNGKVAVKYQPTSTGEHQINVLFNNQAIPGSPFPIAVQSKEAKTQVVKLEPTGVSLGSDFTYSIDTSKATKPVSVTGKVLGPFTKGSVPEALKSKEITVKSFSKVAGKLKVTKPKISEKNKIYTVAFAPSKVGVYLIYVFAGDRLVDKMPYEVYVCDPSKIKVKGPGLGKNKNENSHIDKPLTWEADCTQAGPGTFAAYVGGPDNCTKDVTVEPASSPDQYSISYTPNVPGGYQLLFAFSGFQLSDKPTVMISDPSKAQLGDKGDRVCLVNEKVSFPLDLSAAGAGKLQGKETYVTVNTTEARAVKPKVNVSGPNNEEIPTETTEKTPGVYDITFTPVQGGNHQLHVKACGQLISESPYTLQVFNPSAVQCVNDGPVRVVPGTPVNLEYDISNAGPGSFNLNLSGPEESTIVPSTNEENPNLLSFTFTPNTPGIYEARATFEAIPISEEPLNILVTDTELLVISGSGATGKKAQIGEPVEIVVDISKSGPVPLVATVVKPSGEKEELVFSAKEDNPNLLLASYTPMVSGYYDLIFLVDGEALYKEPLRPYIVNPAEFQIVKEEEIYPMQAVLGQVNSYEIFVANEVQEDGFGVFLLTEDEADTVEEEIKCSVEKLDKDRVKIEYLPEAETAQFVVLTYNEVHISEKLSLAKFDTSEFLMEDLKTSVPVNAETSFVVSGIQSSKYEITAVVTQEDGNNLEAKVESIESEEEGKFKYRISYTPVNIGLLTIIVKCGAISLCDLITVKVFNPSLVTCTGLEDVNVLVGVKVPFAVDTSKAGGGAELLVQLEGPENSSVLCQPVNDCHYSGVLSSERAGICRLRVMYGGIEIPSSPFICRYNRPEPDVAKCSVGDLKATPGEFMIDCRDGGGNGILEVAVYGAFVPARSIAVEHNGDFTFNVKYDIPDPVETFISVKWHGIHLNGSPFKVIFDQ
ncbi:PREDICTED: filamin-A [Amphimedon queenslandica]|uniref:Calponin-homology (CH) domain-containing protein n=1 Tax=Amphimedon queenslandica TaxID=400682 RepID=A0AAN0J1P4_AMPQE|nr:PREDICTED: filamin-A [Amphimedon queenslandica]|eukprot:XP_019850959.1 PREDICTED: filamin-A [Amphimedon queenslandica]